MKSIDAKKLLSYILQVEAAHSDCGFVNCEVTVRGRRGVTEEEQKEDVMKIFSGFGTVKKITFKEYSEKWGMGIICTLEYAFVTQAYFAKLYLDGTSLLIPLKGKILVEIKESAYVKDIMKKVKGILIENLELDKLTYF